MLTLTNSTRLDPPSVRSAGGTPDSWFTYSVVVFIASPSSEKASSSAVASSSGPSAGSSATPAQATATSKAAATTAASAAATPNHGNSKIGGSVKIRMQSARTASSILTEYRSTRF